MYINLLTKIKNAQSAKLPCLKSPFSKMDFEIAELLAKHKLIESVEKRGRTPKRIIDIKLRYSEGRGVISGIEFLSKPSRRLYTSYKNLRPVLQGFGLLVLSTPKGIMVGKDARKEKVGGVMLFKIW
jgi:small subunit ribosomal protein S8